MASSSTLLHTFRSSPSEEKKATVNPLIYDYYAAPDPKLHELLNPFCHKTGYRIHIHPSPGDIRFKIELTLEQEEKCIRDFLDSKESKKELKEESKEESTVTEEVPDKIAMLAYLFLKNDQLIATLTSQTDIKKAFDNLIFESPFFTKIHGVNKNNYLKFISHGDKAHELLVDFFKKNKSATQKAISLIQKDLYKQEVANFIAAYQLRTYLKNQAILPKTNFTTLDICESPPPFAAHLLFNKNPNAIGRGTYRPENNGVEAQLASPLFTQAEVDLHLEYIARELERYCSSVQGTITSEFLKNNGIVSVVKSEHVEESTAIAGVPSVPLFRIVMSREFFKSLSEKLIEKKPGHKHVIQKCLCKSYSIFLRNSTWSKRAVPEGMTCDTAAYAYRDRAKIIIKVQASVTIPFSSTNTPEIIFLCDTSQSMNAREEKNSRISNISKAVDMIGEIINVSEAMNHSFGYRVARFDKEPAWVPELSGEISNEKNNYSTIKAALTRAEFQYDSLYASGRETNILKGLEFTLANVKLGRPTQIFILTDGQDPAFRADEMNALYEKYVGNKGEISRRLISCNVFSVSNDPIGRAVLNAIVSPFAANNSAQSRVFSVPKSLIADQAVACAMTNMVGSLPVSLGQVGAVEPINIGNIDAGYSKTFYFTLPDCKESLSSSSPYLKIGEKYVTINVNDLNTENLAFLSDSEQIEYESAIAHHEAERRCPGILSSPANMVGKQEMLDQLQKEFIKKGMRHAAQYIANHTVTTTHMGSALRETLAAEPSTGGLGGRPQEIYAIKTERNGERKRVNISTVIDRILPLTTTSENTEFIPPSSTTLRISCGHPLPTRELTSPLPLDSVELELKSPLSELFDAISIDLNIEKKNQENYFFEESSKRQTAFLKKEKEIKKRIANLEFELKSPPLSFLRDDDGVCLIDLPNVWNGGGCILADDKKPIVEHVNDLVKKHDIQTNFQRLLSPAEIKEGRRKFPQGTIRHDQFAKQLLNGTVIFYNDHDNIMQRVSAEIALNIDNQIIRDRSAILKLEEWREEFAIKRNQLFAEASRRNIVSDKIEALKFQLKINIKTYDDLTKKLILERLDFQKNYAHIITILRNINIKKTLHGSDQISLENYAKKYLSNNRVLYGTLTNLNKNPAIEFIPMEDSLCLFQKTTIKEKQRKYRQEKEEKEKKHNEGQNNSVITSIETGSGSNQGEKIINDQSSRPPEFKSSLRSTASNIEQNKKEDSFILPASTARCGIFAPCAVALGGVGMASISLSVSLFLSLNHGNNAAGTSCSTLAQMFSCLSPTQETIFIISALLFTIGIITMICQSKKENPLITPPTPN
jgi:hypothetical protein